MRPRVDPFLLNFITLGIIITFLILTIYSIVQHMDISSRVAEKEEAATEIDNERLYDILYEIAINQNLTKDVLQEQVDQLIPPRATEERQIQAEQDHFNQTAIILDSIRESGNQTRVQAEQINQTLRHN